MSYINKHNRNYHMSQTSTVAIFKLVNGEELIGEWITSASDVETVYTIRRPLKVTIVRDPSTGQPGKALMDWVILAPEIEQVEIHRHVVMCRPIQATRELADVWLQQTSGLILATGQLNG